MFDFLVRPFRKNSDGDSHYCRIIKDIFGFKPGNIELYKLALIHKSASLAMPDGNPINNERLEFLGDAVLESVVSDFLFIEFPQSDEGFLTQMRSKIVRRATLNDLCVKIGLSEHIISHAAGYVQKHLHGDALEAMIGAIYLDKGYDFVNRLLINGLFAKYLDMDSMTERETDYKSRLIEWCQKSRHAIRFDTRPDADSTANNPKFRSVVVIDRMEMGYGFGTTKKEAEQNAALSVSQFSSEDIGINYLEMVDRAVAVKSGTFAETDSSAEADVRKPARRRKPRAAIDKPEDTTGSDSAAGHSTTSSDRGAVDKQSMPVAARKSKSAKNTNDDDR